MIVAAVLTKGLPQHHKRLHELRKRRPFVKDVVFPFEIDPEISAFVAWWSPHSSQNDCRQHHIRQSETDRGILR